MPLKQSAVIGYQQLAAGTKFESKREFDSVLRSVFEKKERRLAVNRSTVTNFEAGCRNPDCNFHISAGVQDKGHGGWKVSSFLGHSLTCDSPPVGGSAHALTARQLAPVVHDLYRSDPSALTWKQVQVAIRTYLVSAGVAVRVSARAFHSPCFACVLSHANHCNSHRFNSSMYSKGLTA